MKRKDLDLFIDPREIETERLFLKKITVKDLIDVYEYTSDPTVSEFLLWSKHRSIEYTKEYLLYIEYLYKKCKFFDFGIKLKESGKMIGTCGFSKFDFLKNSAYVGYVLNSKFWGLGYAGEALSAVLKFGFDTLQLSSIGAELMEENVRSKRLLEKLGFHKTKKTREMRVKGSSRLIIRYEITRESFEGNKS